MGTAGKSKWSIRTGEEAVKSTSLGFTTFTDSRSLHNSIHVHFKIRD